jgi:uncharacterized membrane protein
VGYLFFWNSLIEKIIPKKLMLANFGVVTIILIAFALRLHNLTYHSLWFDEAVSVHWAKQDISRILEVGFTLKEDRLPPLYYLMLKGWTTIFGLSEFSVRSLSVFFGTLLVPVMMRIATRLVNRQVAIITGLLVTLNPFLIWYSQEARMYAPAVLFACLSVYSCVTQSSDCDKKQAKNPYEMLARSTYHPLFFIIFSILALYSHLYAGFLLPALGLWLIISYPRHWKLWLSFTGSVLIITLAYAPILWAIWQFSGEATPGNPFTGVADRAWWLLHAFVIWKAPLSDNLTLVIEIVTILLVILAVLDLDFPNSHSQILIILLLIFPFLIANLLLYRNHLAFFGERYFIVMVPWLLLLVAIGLEELSNFLEHLKNRYSITKKLNANGAIGKITTFGLCLLFVPVIMGQWSVPASKETWRQTVAYLADHAEPNQGILIHPDWVRYPFQFYFQGAGQTYAAFSDVSPDSVLDGPLQGVVGDHPVIWLIQSHEDGPDPQRLVEQWFASRYPLVTELYPPGITLKGYAPGYQMNQLPPVAVPVDIQFDNGLNLVGYQADDTASATDVLFHPPSGWVHVTLYWTASTSLAEDANSFVHVTDAAGVWGVSLDRPTDALRFYPPSRWTTGQIIRQDVDVNLNPATPPGRYQLVVGLADSEAQYPLAEVEIH